MSVGSLKWDTCQAQGTRASEVPKALEADHNRYRAEEQECRLSKFGAFFIILNFEYKGQQ